MTGWEWLSFIRAGALATLIGVALGVVARGAVRAGWHSPNVLKLRHRPSFGRGSIREERDDF